MIPLWSSADSLSFKSFSSRYANPGVSLGYGGNRPMLVSPMLTLSSDLVEASFIYYKSDRSQLLGAGLSLSPFKMRNDFGRVFEGGVGIGYSYDQRAPEIQTRFTRTNVLAHLNSFKPGSHLSWQIQLGVSVQEEQNLAIDLGSFQYQNYKVLPWAGFSLRLNAFSLPEPTFRVKKELVIEDTLSFHRKAMFGRYFNPSAGFGFGAGYGEFGGLKFRLNLGRIHITTSQNISFHDFQKYHVNELGYGIDLFKLRLPRQILGNNYLHYLSLYTTQSLYSYTCNGPFGRFCDQQLSRFSYLIGVNSYRINGRSSYSFKIGIGEMEGKDRFGTFTDNSIYPMLELGFQTHIFKFRDHVYLRLWEKPSTAMEIYERESRKNVQARFNNIFRPFASFGLGVNHAFGMAPALGFEFWRLRVGFSAFMLQDLGISSNAELLLIKTKKDNYVTFGASVGNVSYSLYYSSLHIGYSHKLAERGSLEIQAGFGQMGYVFFYRQFPSVDISYHLYLRKHHQD
ncbi:hypothetical protein GYB22_13180 [bacterium]|nr:hypothetical protein [bacterium]